MVQQPVQEQKVSKYSEVLIHCINVSLQEHQKKLFVFQKKTNKKSQYGIQSPELQYMNNYQSTTSRLNCFKTITDQFCDPEECYHHGDAGDYESYLDQQLKQKQLQVKQTAPSCYDAGYTSEPTIFYEQPTNVVTNIFYSLNAKKMMQE